MRWSIVFWAILFIAWASAQDVGVKPPAAPDDWRGLLGIYYGTGEQRVIVFEKDGNFLVGKFRKNLVSMHSLLGGKEIHFVRFGRSVSFCMGTNIYHRNSRSFLIPPRLPIDVLRKEALAAVPPMENGDFKASDLVELKKIEPGIMLDIRYATAGNFMGCPVYESSRAFLQRPAALALQRVHRRLKRWGYGLLVFDAYRPWYVTKIFWDATPDDKKDFVADPSKGSRHNRGAAVDVSLYRLDSRLPVAMPSDYDDFSEAAYVNYPGGSSLQRRRRDLLRAVMEQEGFAVYPYEWWHFDYEGWKHYPILNEPF